MLAISSEPRSYAAVLLAATLSLGAADCQPQATPGDRPARPQGQPVIAISHQISALPPQAVEVAVQPLRDGSPRLPPTRAAPSEGYLRPLANAALNSRLSGAVGEGPYRERWVADVDPAVTPNVVLRDASRILVHGGAVLQLFDLQGTTLRTESTGPGGALLDPRPELFYATGRLGDLHAYRLRDGERAFTVSLPLGETYAIPLLARQGLHLLVVGVARDVLPHAPRSLDESVIESKRLGAPLRVGADGFLDSIEASGALLIESSRLVAALHGDTLAFAVPGRLYFAGPDLQIRAAYEADFRPVSLSLDESGRAHLIVDEGGERHALWVVSPEGERQVRLPLGDELRNLVAPPIIGYDGRIYLVSRSLVVAVSPQGQRLWERPTRATVAGAGVTTDDRLLVSAGSELLVFEPDGSLRVLHEFPGDTLRTPPAVLGDEIAVASTSRLYSLSR